MEDIMGLANTPRANQLHIGIFGKRNSGKSSFINAITNQELAIVSDVAGTTADPVYKTMEVHGIGPCVFIDTAGFDDIGSLGKMRVAKTKEVMDKTDLAVLILTDGDVEQEVIWARELKSKKIPYLLVLNKIDECKDLDPIKDKIIQVFKEEPLCISAKKGQNIQSIREALIRKLPLEYEQESIVGDLIAPLDVVVLVMPQDIQAPKGRLILPQVQTIRDLLDHHAMVVSCTTEQFSHTLGQLVKPPKLIITDSQAFQEVYRQKPKESLLTSFSVLFAKYKGDIQAFVEGASAIATLTQESRVLIAEACTHAPLSEDIGRVKIPTLLRKRIGQQLTIDIVSGSDFPENLSSYDLIIHCGACMFNRKYVLSRIAKASNQGVKITNYGITMAYLMGILEDVCY